MKRRGFLLLLLMGFFPLISAGSIGISPARFELFFEPGMKEEFHFSVVDADSEGLLEAYLTGDLVEYASLSETNFIGEGSFNVFLALPEKIERPGKHRLLVGVRQKLSEEGDTGFKGLAAIQAVVDIFVPYPGIYAEGEFNVQDINEGENSSYSLLFQNLGMEDIVFNSEIKVFEGEIVKTSFKLLTTPLKSKETKEFKGILDTAELSPGIYDVKSFLEYGDELVLNDSLRVGDHFVNITNYSYNLESGKINRFEMNVKNLWNLEIKGVYLMAGVSSNGEFLDQFQSASINLKPWEENILVGFLDATNITAGKYLANFNVYYENETTTKLAYIYIIDSEKEQDYYPLMVAGIVFLGIICFSLLLLILLKFRKIIKVKFVVEDIGKDEKRKK